jgi:predicted transcriptional regulator
MLSIRPKWCEKIASGKKTIEVRKTKTKLETPFKAYIYCTMPDTRDPHNILELHGADGKIRKANGKVIGEFTCDRIYELAPLNHAPDDVEKQACLTREEIVDYLKGTGYGWHIVDLRIYDQPRELTEFRRACPNSWYCESCVMHWENNGTCGNERLQIKRAPQSWCYVEAMDNG